jgi:hypothetical protein
MREKRNVYRLLLGKPEGKRPPGRPRRRWVDNIKMDFGEIFGIAWTGLVWLRIDKWTAVVKEIMNVRVP